MTAVEILIETAKQAQCDCTVRERDGGHKIDCWKPYLENAVTNAEKELVGSETVAPEKEAV